MVILIEIGGFIGVLPTVGLVVLTAVAGIWLLRLEGLATLHRVQNRLARGETPERELLEGVMLIFGGALLLTPGFATDAAGFICLIPGLRRPLAKRILSNFQFASIRMPNSGTAPGGHTIDGEFQREEGHSMQTEIDHHDRPARNKKL